MAPTCFRRALLLRPRFTVVIVPAVCSQGGRALPELSTALPTPARALTSVRECRDIQQEPT